MLLFLDEADLNLNPTLSRCWAKKGERKVVVTPRQNQKRYVSGAIELLGRETFWGFSSRKDSASFSQFVEGIMKSLSHKKVILVLDNFIAHKSALTLERLSPYEDEGRLQRFFLPRYAPELNPTERIWQQMRRRVTHNHRFLNLDELERAVDDFFTELEHNPETITSLVGLRKEREVVYTA
jgi:transposase